MRREAAAQQRLDHPNICRVKTLDQDDEGRWRLIMEYVRGSTLAEQFSRLTLDRRVELLATVCDALQHAHAAGILHRDLKPANILLRETETGDWSPVVADFGLALGVDDPALTTTGEILGSPAYMSPEQARGDPDAIGPGSDIFSIGCMLYEALAGRPPFEGTSVSDSLDRLLNAEAAHPRTHNPHAPEPLCRIALQCLEQSPARRYASAASVASDLRRWSAGQTIEARRYTRFYRLQREIRKRPVESAAAGLAALALLVLLAWGAGTARTAEIREASAATLGTALADVRRRMTIARLAPPHDIGTDRAALRAELERLEAEESDRAATADLLYAALAAGYIEIGELDRADAASSRAFSIRDAPASRSVRARTLLARYADTVAALMDLPADQREERLAAARVEMLQPAQKLVRPLTGTRDEPAEALARLSIVEQRFDDAERRIASLRREHPQDYTPELLTGALQMERAEAALAAAERDRAATLFSSAQDTFEAVIEIGRSDPRPRLLACRAARGELRATMSLGGEFPADLDGLHPGCGEVVDVDPGNPDTHAARASAWSTLAEAFEGVNATDPARRSVRAGLDAAAEALSLAPGDANALEQQARLYLRLAGLEKGPWTQAQAHFDAAADAAEDLKSLRPNYPAGQLLIALIERDRARHLELHGQPDAALAALGRAQDAFEAVLQQFPDSTVALSGAALNAVFHFYEFRPSDPDRAVRWMERAIALQDRALAQDPDNVDLLFDQGANHGDLWYYLLLTPQADAKLAREELLQGSLSLLARIRELAPQRPTGYSQPIMILLSGADHRIDHGQDARAALARALELKRAADSAGVALDRNLPAWIQQARVRNVLAQDGEAGPIFADAFAAIDLPNDEVAASDRFYQHVHQLELIGLYQRWLRETGQPADEDRFAQAHVALEQLLAEDRRQAGVLCSGGRVLLEEVLAGVAAERPGLEGAREFFEECLDTDPDFEARYGADLAQVRSLLVDARSEPRAGGG